MARRAPRVPVQPRRGRPTKGKPLRRGAHVPTVRLDRRRMLSSHSLLSTGRTHILTRLNAPANWRVASIQPCVLSGTPYKILTAFSSLRPHDITPYKMLSSGLRACPLPQLAAAGLAPGRFRPGPCDVTHHQAPPDHVAAALRRRPWAHLQHHQQHAVTAVCPPGFARAAAQLLLRARSAAVHRPPKRRHAAPGPPRSQAAGLRAHRRVHGTCQPFRFRQPLALHHARTARHSHLRDLALGAGAACRQQQHLGSAPARAEPQQRRHTARQTWWICGARSADPSRRCLRRTGGR